MQIKAYGIADGIRNVRVNKEKLEEILSSQKSMQNYEEALWSFEKSLNNEIKENRLNLVQEMQAIQQKHEDSRALKETSSSLKYLDDGISHRQSRVQILRNQIEEIELQNNRIKHMDEHRKDIARIGSELISFNLLKNEHIVAISDSDYHNEAELKGVLSALDQIHFSLMHYSKHKRHSKQVVNKKEQQSSQAEPRFIKDSIDEMEQLRRVSLNRLIDTMQEEIVNQKAEIDQHTRQQLNMAKVMQLLVSSRFLKFLKPRNPFL